MAHLIRHIPPRWEFVRSEPLGGQKRRELAEKQLAEINKTRGKPTCQWWEEQRYVDQVAPSQFVNPDFLDTFKYRYQVYARPSIAQCPPVCLAEVTDDPPPIRYNVKRMAVDKKWDPDGVSCNHHWAKNPWQINCCLPVIPENVGEDCSRNNSGRSTIPQSSNCHVDTMSRPRLPHISANTDANGNHRVRGTLDVPRMSSDSRGLYKPNVCQGELNLRKQKHEAAVRPSQSSTTCSGLSESCPGSPRAGNLNNNQVKDCSRLDKIGSRARSNNYKTDSSDMADEGYGAWSGVQNGVSPCEGHSSRGPKPDPMNYCPEHSISWPCAGLKNETSCSRALSGSKLKTAWNNGVSSRLGDVNRDTIAGLIYNDHNVNTDNGNINGDSNHAQSAKDTEISNKKIFTHSKNIATRSICKANNKIASSDKNIANDITNIASCSKNTQNAESNIADSKRIIANAASNTSNQVISNAVTNTPTCSKTISNSIATYNLSNNNINSDTQNEESFLTDNLVGTCIQTIDSNYDEIQGIESLELVYPNLVSRDDIGCLVQLSPDFLDYQHDYLSQNNNACVYDKNGRPQCIPGPHRESVCPTTPEPLQKMPTFTQNKISRMELMGHLQDHVKFRCFYHSELQPKYDGSTIPIVVDGDDRRMLDMGYMSHKIIGGKPNRLPPPKDYLSQLKLPPHLEEYREFTRRCPNPSLGRVDQSSAANEMLLPSHITTSLIPASRNPFMFSRNPNCHKVSPLFHQPQITDDLHWNLPSSTFL